MRPASGAPKRSSEESKRGVCGAAAEAWEIIPIPPNGTMSGQVLFCGAHPFGDLMSQTILVTGASSGIGQSTAQLLAERGFTVFGTARKPDAAKRAPFTMLALDVRSDESVRACMEQVIAKAGRLDVLVNNAGYAMMGAAEETSVEEAKAQFETNFFGIVRMVNAVLPGMRAAGAGKIINISSLAGNTAIPFSAFYSATKFCRPRDIPNRCGTKSDRLVSV